MTALKSTRMERLVPAERQSAQKTQVYILIKELSVIIFQMLLQMFLESIYLTQVLICMAEKSATIIVLSQILALAYL